MSIKKVVPYFCVLREGYYVIIWLIVRICVFIKIENLYTVNLKKEKHGEFGGGQNIFRQHLGIGISTHVHQFFLWRHILRK
jgi:hypothetical protein